MKTIRIPKLDPGQFVDVQILKGQSTEKQMTLKKQVIEGVTIPKGTTLDVYAYAYRNHAGDTCAVLGDVINPTLRYLYLEKLRRQK